MITDIAYDMYESESSWCRTLGTIVPTPYCQLTDPERQDQELLDIDLAEAPELPVSAPDEPLQVRCARARRDR